MSWIYTDPVGAQTTDTFTNTVSNNIVTMPEDIASITNAIDAAWATQPLTPNNINVVAGWIYEPVTGGTTNTTYSITLNAGACAIVTSPILAQNVDTSATPSFTDVLDTKITTNNIVSNTSISTAINNIDNAWAAQPQNPNNINLLANWSYIPISGGITNTGYSTTINAGAIAYLMSNPVAGSPANIVQVATSTFVNTFNSTDNNCQQCFQDIDNYVGVNGSTNLSPAYLNIPTGWLYEPFSTSLTGNASSIMVNTGAYVSIRQNPILLQ